MSSNKDKARLRRHHEARVRSKHKQDVVYKLNPSENIGKHSKTPCSCSCIMCGNPRKFNGNSKSSLSVQEQKQLDSKY